MKDLKLDFINKTIINEYVDNKDRVLQQIRLAVQVWTGDWFLDESAGIDYETAYGNKLLMQSFTKAVISQVPGISSIKSFKLNKKMDFSDNKETYFIDTQIVFDNELISVSIDI